MHDQERQELARRLHDGIVQQLTAAMLLCDSALLRLGEAEPAYQPLRGGVDELRSAVASCRALMAELRGEGEADG